MFHNATLCLVQKKTASLYITRRLQGVHSLPEFARKLADAIVCVLDAASANGGAHFNDFENTASICCDCLSEVAKTCKLASLNRDCQLLEVSLAAQNDCNVFQHQTYFAITPHQPSPTIFTSAQILSALEHVIASVELYPSCSPAIQDLRSAAVAVRARPTEKAADVKGQTAVSYAAGGLAAAVTAVKGMKIIQVSSTYLARWCLPGVMRRRSNFAKQKQASRTFSTPTRCGFWCWMACACRGSACKSTCSRWRHALCVFDGGGCDVCD